MKRNLLKIDRLYAGVLNNDSSRQAKEIIKGLSLNIKVGETHVLMGPNGSGKSTLANLLAGHPGYGVHRGKIIFEGQNITKLSPDERAKLGLFLAFQYPVEVVGVSLFNFLKTAYGATHPRIDYKEFSEKAKNQASKLKINPDFLSRAINEGFSGGEKKKAEILQLVLLEPKLAVLDETDSGLDIDALKIVAEGINNFKLKVKSEKLKIKQSPSVLLITHYFRILKYVKPDFVHVMINGRIVKSGGPDLALKLEEKGYDWLSEFKPS